MSLIHAALEKVEQEKKERKEELPSAVWPSASRETRRREAPWVVYAMVVGLTLFFVAGIFYLLTDTSRSGKARKGAGLSPGENKAGTFFFSPSLNQDFALTGITRVGGEWTAIVNNELVRVGDSVSGARVEVIEPEKVILKAGDQKIALNLYGEASTHFTHLEVAA